MICPKCMVQMHQLVETDTIEPGVSRYYGGGDSTEDGYSTYMVLECPSCEGLIKESYEAKMITREEADELRPGN